MRLMRIIRISYASNPWVMATRPKSKRILQGMICRRATTMALRRWLAATTSDADYRAPCGLLLTLWDRVIVSEVGVSLRSAPLAHAVGGGRPAGLVRRRLRCPDKQHADEPVRPTEAECLIDAAVIGVGSGHPFAP